MLELQVADVALLNTDLWEQMPCNDKTCKHVAPLAAMFVWRVWRKDEWVYFPFCHDHILSCIPVVAMGRS